MNRPSDQESNTRKPAANRESSKIEKIDRRSVVRKGAKAAYVVPAVLAAIKASENPVIAQTPQPEPQ